MGAVPPLSVSAASHSEILQYRDRPVRRRRLDYDLTDPAPFGLDASMTGRQPQSRSSRGPAGGIDRLRKGRWNFAVRATKVMKPRPP